VLTLSACTARKADASLPYTTERAFKLSFEQPLGIVSAPGETNRLFILEKPGRIVVITDLEHPTKKTFMDLTRLVGSDEVEQGVLALAFHPKFAENHQFFVWYTANREENGTMIRQDRLSRFTLSTDDPNRGDLKSEVQLISQSDDAPNHNGGELQFGLDGYLYLSLGDEGGFNDEHHNSQLIDRDFFSGILRLDVDRRPGNLPPNPHPAVHAGTYSVPADNPFVGVTQFNGRKVDPSHVHTEFWAVGLRNPWRMSIDPVTGTLWCADVGQDLYEEVDIITRGGNYGWNYREAFHEFRGSPPPEAKFVDPIWEYPHSQGVSITGGIVSHGARYPDLEGKYLFADFALGRIWALTPDGTNRVSADHVQLIGQGEAIASFGRDPRNGDVLIASLGNGDIRRLVPNPKHTK
jgi:glucose/arabinose dehydrogenase